MTMTDVQVRDPKELLGHDLWVRTVTLLMRDKPHWDRVMTERVLGQAVAYLITCFETWDIEPGLEIGAGELVDEGVHALVLDTANYREFCARHFGGRFLDHIPEIDRKYDGTVQRTAAIVEQHGFEVDWPLWERDFMKCSPCHGGSKCH
ncbi:glycine-rich domain-containing protein [Yinghuangia sp. YIM S09857]|uniref:glycine-rich domain-containing protein n=1 Tax=Yinghuangia sp. YIM S09857 TaxID=3436929 RepID=UPI003F53851E